ncbi:MAG: response regulator [Alphaproteobacteria bacterium]|nr:response regulator [Alphaproteobacteria bacterium]
MTEQPLRGLRLLIIEDEFLIASTMAFTLGEHGVSVIGPALSIARALECIAAGGIDGALLDLKLHGEFSIPVADALRQSNIPFILVTGFQDDASPTGLRAQARLQKPFQDSDLVALCTRTFGPARREGSGLR